MSWVNTLWQNLQCSYTPLTSLWDPVEVRKRNVSCSHTLALCTGTHSTTRESHLLCMVVWHDGKHVSLAQYPLPPRVISSLVPHLVVVAAVCIEHLGHVTWGQGYKHASEDAQHGHAPYADTSINRPENVNMRLRNTPLQSCKCLESFV